MFAGTLALCMAGSAYTEPPVDAPAAPGNVAGSRLADGSPVFPAVPLVRPDRRAPHGPWRLERVRIRRTGAKLLHGYAWLSRAEDANVPPAWGHDQIDWVDPATGRMVAGGVAAQHVLPDQADKGEAPRACGASK